MSLATPVAPAFSRIAWNSFRLFRITFALLPLLAVHFALLAIPWIEFSWWYLLYIAVLTRIIGYGVTIGLHRGCTHRAFKSPRWLQFALAAAGCTALQKGPIWWAAHHRLHHRHSDQPGDPHSPVVDGFVYGHMGWLFSNDLLNPDESNVRDLKLFPELRLLDRLWMVPGILMAAICFAIGGWGGLVYGYCLSVVLIFQATFAINSIGHMFGPQRYDTRDSSRNNLLLGYIAMGDGWHNNHHRAPTSARHGFAWYEYDSSYNMIRLLALVGLAWDIKLPPQAALSNVRTRPEQQR